MTAEQLSTSRWCLGLPSVGVRQLPPDEIERLRSELSAASRKLLLPLTLAAASPASLYVSYLVHGNGPEPPLPRLVVVCMFLFAGIMIFPAASLLVLRDATTYRRALRRDLLGGRAERFFTSRLDETSVGDGTSTGVDAAIQSLDVLPHSGLVFLLNDAPPVGRLTAEVYESAVQPQSPPRYEIPAAAAAALSASAGQQAHTTRRRLTEGELGELARHIRSARRPPWTLIGFLAWSAIGAVAAFVANSKGEFLLWTRRYGIPFFAVAVSATWQLVRYARQIAAARSARQDLRDGWVLLVRQAENPGAELEILPISQLLWSIDGVPPEWRLAKADSALERTA